MAFGFRRGDVLAMSEAEMEATLRLLTPPAQKPSPDSGGRKATRVKSLRKQKPVVNHANP